MHSGHRSPAILQFLGSAVLLLVACSALAQNNTIAPTRGKRFWTGFMQNGFGAQTLRVHVMGTNATTGTVSIPLTGWSAPFTVAANGAAVINVPLSAENQGSMTVQNKGVLIEAQDSVNVFISSFQNFTHDLSQILPDNALGNIYRVDSYLGLPNFNNLHRSELLIIAIEDGTQLRITPSVPTFGGAPAGVPFIVDLNAGQTYQLQAAQDVMDLTGTLVEATEASGNCRPFAVIGGSMCASVPGGCQACDAIFEQLLPINAWGTRFYTAPIQGVSSSTYRILAHEANTIVTIGNGSPITLNAGQRHEVNGTSTPVCIQANQPVSVVQLMEGYSCAGNGDPSLLLVSPHDRMSTSALFHTPTSTQLSTHSIGLVIPPASVGQVTVDGVVVNPALFQAYAGCADRLHARLSVPAGTHRVQAANGFQLYMFGIGFGESYAASVSDIHSFPVPQDSVVCGIGTVILNAPGSLTSIQWAMASAPNTIIATSSSITVQPTSSESYTVTGEQPISGCTRTFTYHVGIPLTIPTLLTANGTSTATICQYQPVQLALDPPPDPAWFQIQWEPATSLDNANIATPLATPLMDTWYTVYITSPSGCGDMVDSIFVAVSPGNILQFDVTPATLTLCTGASANLASTALRVVASDRFNGPPGSMWNAIQGGTISAACGSTSGTALYFNGNGQRSAQTIGLNTLGGGEVRSHLKIADDVAPCDDADPGEGVVLEYSNNNGFSWNPLSSFNENAYPVFTPIAVTIPPAAQTSNTMFRLRQLANSGAGQDNWAFDDFLVARYDNAWLNYVWTPGLVGSPSSASTTLSPSTSGWYVLQGTDPSSGCTYSDSSWVQVHPALSLTLTGNTTLCNAAGIQLQAQPNLASQVSYTWTPNNSTLSATNVAEPLATPQTTTTYSVVGTSSEGCTATGQVTITVGQLLGLDLTADNTTLCQGQSTVISAQVNGGGNPAYAWSGNGLSDPSSSNPVATPQQTTTYTCVITDATSGCQLSATIAITVNTGYTANAGADLTLCSTLGHQLTVQHNVPNPTYLWNPLGNLNSALIQSPTITADASASYVVTVSDPNGCSVSDEVTITRAFATLPTTLNTSACANTPPQLSAPATGLSYSWNTGASTPSITPSNSGNYTVTMTDAQGCQGTTTFNVLLHPLPVVQLGPGINVCGSATQVLNAGNPGASFQWSTGATGQTISTTTSGTYGVTVTNSNGCSASGSVVVQFHPMPVDVLQDVTLCITTPPLLNAGNAGSTYLWNTGAVTPTITAGSSGLYSVLVTTMNGCSATFDAEVELAPEVVVMLGNDTTICAGQTLVLDAGNPGSNYQWNTGSTDRTIQPTISGVHNVLVNNGYCTGSGEVTVTVSPVPQNDLQDVTVCEDELVTLDAGNPGSTYLWNTGATTPALSIPSSGSYSVLVTNNSGCSASYTSSVQYISPPVVALGADTVLCEGQFLLLDAGSPGAQYTWNNGASSRMLEVRTAGAYSVTVNNGYCVRSDAIAVQFNPSPAQLTESQVQACLDDPPYQVALDAGNPGSFYSWNTGSTSRTITATAYGWYTVDIRNNFDCILRDSVIVIEHCPSTIFIPNTFTPNGDGMNDIFIPVGKNIETMQLLIFDRWGELLFESRDPSIGWDGSYHGELVKNDVYVWKLRYRFTKGTEGHDGFEKEQIGHIQVLR